MNRPSHCFFVLATVGCLLDLPGVTDEGVHVVVAVDPGLQLCGGSISNMDAFVAALSAEFSLPERIGDDRPVFYWLGREDFHGRTHCPKDTSCAFFGNAYSDQAPNNHELVHVVAEALGYPRPVFIEGLAVAFEGLADEAPEEAKEPGDVRGLLGFTTGVQVARAGGYRTAGAFTSFLIQQHGLAAYLRVYEAVGPFESEGGIDAVFREEFGASLDDSIADFESEPACSRAGRDAKLLECSAPELAWEGDRISLHRSIACDQDDAVGPFGSGSAIVYYTVELAEAGDYEVAVIGDGPENHVTVTPCTICGGDGVTIVADEDPRTIALDAGRYAVRLAGPADVRTSVGFRLRRAAGAEESPPMAPEEAP